MATIQITVPNQYVADLTAAIEAEFGDGVAGKSAAEKGTHAIHPYLRGLYARHKHRTAIAANQQTLDDAEAALKVAKDAAAVARDTAGTDARAAAEAAADSDWT